MKNIDLDKGEIVQDFVQPLITLHNKTDIVVTDKKCQKVMNACKEEDYDVVDGILDDIKQAKNNLILFAKKAAAKEQFKQIGKEMFKLIFKIIKDSIEDEVDFTHVIMSLIKIILSSLC